MINEEFFFYYYIIHRNRNLWCNKMTGSRSGSVGGNIKLSYVYAQIDS